MRNYILKPLLCGPESLHKLTDLLCLHLFSAFACRVEKTHEITHLGATNTDPVGPRFFGIGLVVGHHFLGRRKSPASSWISFLLEERLPLL